MSGSSSTSSYETTNTSPGTGSVQGHSEAQTPEVPTEQKSQPTSTTATTTESDSGSSTGGASSSTQTPNSHSTASTGPGHSRNSSAQTARYKRTDRFNPFGNWEFTPAHPESSLTQDNKQLVLQTYEENSHIYHHDQYNAEFSDDDFDIMQMDANEKIRSKDGTWYKYKPDTKKERWLIKTHERSTSNTSGSASSTSQGSTRESDGNSNSENGGAYANVPPRARSKEDLAERGEVISDEHLHDDLSFKQRCAYRYDKVEKYVLAHLTWKWAGFLFAVLLSIFVVVFFPVADRFGWFKKQPPGTFAYEEITHYRYPQLAAIRQEMVDPDTPQSALTRKNIDGDDWELTFSDEFNEEGRTFYPGMDQFWEAADIHYAATQDLEWYDPDAATTKEGTLQLRLDVMHNHGLFYRSGMMQSWNKMCFSEGILEVSAKMPGTAYTAGTWPGIWTLGNLARPGYLATTDGVWPYSYNECDAGITANQSSPDGLSYLPGQRLNKCTCKGEEHPNPGVGRGAPELDLLEGAHSTNFATDSHSGVASQTLQIAPFDIWYAPDYEFVAVHNFSKSNINSYLGTPYQEMLCVQTTANETWYEAVVTPEHPTRKTDATTYFQKYAVEYISKQKDHTKNYARFFLGDEATATIQGTALHPNGNIGWRDMPKEPMSIVLNLGLSASWSSIQWLNFFFPMTFEIDYVRVYQPKGHKNGITCDPKDYPTTDYINDHMNAYRNANLTSWADAGYSIPLNKLTSDKC